MLDCFDRPCAATISIVHGTVSRVCLGMIAEQQSYEDATSLYRSAAPSYHFI